MSLQLHRVRIDTLRYTKVVTVLATSPEAASRAASGQAVFAPSLEVDSKAVSVIAVTYLGLAESLIVGDAPWLLAESLDSDGGDL